MYSKISFNETNKATHPHYIRSQQFSNVCMYVFKTAGSSLTVLCDEKRDSIELTSG